MCTVYVWFVLFQHEALLKRHFSDILVGGHGGEAKADLVEENSCGYYHTREAQGVCRREF
jgi:hypothetical protein